MIISKINYIVNKPNQRPCQDDLSRPIVRQISEALYVTTILLPYSSPLVGVSRGSIPSVASLSARHVTKVTGGLLYRRKGANIGFKTYRDRGPNKSIQIAQVEGRGEENSLITPTTKSKYSEDQQESPR